MMQQPYFGRRLKELRLERGLSQAALASGEISTGYLSRLESGGRRPPDHLVAFFAERLGVSPAAFETPPARNSLAQALSIAMSTDGEEAMTGLIDVLYAAVDDDAVLRWQALWHVSRHWYRLGERDKERACLTELTQIAEELDMPELMCRGWSELARLLRTAGEAAGAVALASRAHRLAVDAHLSVNDLAGALRCLVAAEAEEGRLQEARLHVDELVALAERGVSTDLRVEALWSAATVRTRLGDHAGARELIERALREVDTDVDLGLRVRLWLAAASLYLQSEPPLTDQGRACLEHAGQALALVGTSTVRRQELLMLRAFLAFQEGQFVDARRMHDEIDADELRITYRDRVRLNVLDSQLMILEGDRKQGLRRLKELGNETSRTTNADLAAYVWRLLAETLENSPPVEASSSVIE